MGFDPVTLIAGISALVGVVGNIASAQAAAGAANAQKEANRIAGNQNKIENLESRRQAIREERVRRAKIITASENTGTGGSSGELGALGALSSNLAGLVSSASGQSKANAGINAANQRAVDLNTTAQTISGFTQAIQNGISSFGNTVFDKD